MKDKIQTLKNLREYAKNMHNYDDVEALDWAINKLEHIFSSESIIDVEFREIK